MLEDQWTKELESLEKHARPISWNLSWHPALTTKNKMRIPHSHAFIDLTTDFTADLFLTTLSASSTFQFEIWENVDGNFSLNTVFEKPPNMMVVGQSAFADFGKILFIFQILPLSLTYFPLSYSNQQAFLLENVPCNNASCEGAHRMFKVYWELMDLNQIRDAMVATFFDIYEDGILDIVVLSKGYTKNDFAIHTLKNNFEADAYFVKVIVLSGLCSNDCPRKITVSKLNSQLAVFTKMPFFFLINLAGQLSQSAHLALQLPYNVLGLGRSANFLDHLYVGIPRPSGEKSVRKQEWTAIIPNSQLIVIPYPHNVPRSWSAKLYLTPSNIVLLTAIALIGVCVFILAIIGILHWQEKVCSFMKFVNL
nr:T-cell immunomodulatory protein [Mirounga angustirostris]